MCAGQADWGVVAGEWSTLDFLKRKRNNLCLFDWIPMPNILYIIYINIIYIIKYILEINLDMN